MPSTVIKRFLYDADARALYVTFVSGQRYLYEGVPPEVATDWRAAFSKGEFFAAHIRDRYPYRRLGRDPDPPAGQPAVSGPSGPASPPPAAAERSDG
jgi:hypothetical protein